MPYIKNTPYTKFETRRQALDPTGKVLDAGNAGELNYQITCLARRYLSGFGTNYDTMNTIVGAIESAKAEFQRRVVAPYEDKKIKENGDVYPS